MIWKDIGLDEVTTHSVIYFEEEYKDTCSRICEVLFIDCFPTIEGKTYWKKTENSWEKKIINYETSIIREAFDKKLLGLFSANDSNIVFVSNDNFISGVIHFTNYESAQVYSALYRNFNVFEKSLREYLMMNGLDDEKYLDYLENYKLKRERGKGQQIGERRLDELKKVKGQKRSFENNYLLEIMEFAVSSFHSKTLLEKLDLNFLKAKQVFDNREDSVMKLVNRLRNQVMHHDNISGQSVFTPHNFEDFKQFFELVLIFRLAFEQLSERVEKLNRKKSHMINKKKLDLVSRMEDEEIIDYFYSLI
jgi:hypothetical protein